MSENTLWPGTVAINLSGPEDLPLSLPSPSGRLAQAEAERLEAAVERASQALYAGVEESHLYPQRRTLRVESGYLADCWDPNKLDRIVEVTALRALEVLDTVAFDAIVFRGVSGALVAPGVARLLGLPLACVRKRGQSHSHREVEGAIIEYGRYLAIDDFVDTGTTLHEIRYELERKDARLVAAVLYARPAMCPACVPCFSVAHNFQLYGSDSIPF